MQEPTPGTTFTWDQVQEMLRTMGEQNREAMREFAMELRKPSQEEQEKKEQEQALRVRAAKEQAQIAAEETAARKAMQANCRHTKENGKTAIMGQVHSDGKWHGICFRCGFEATPVAISNEGATVGGLGDSRGFDAAA